MAPVIVLVSTFVLFTVLGRFGVKAFTGVGALRAALAAMFLLTAGAHFVEPLRSDLVAIVPPAVPAPEFWVTLTGIAEALGAVGLLLRRTAPWAAAGLLVLLVAVFPANVYEAQAGLSVGGAPPTPLWPRALLQLAFIASVGIAGFWAPLRRRLGSHAGRSPRSGAGLDARA